MALPAQHLRWLSRSKYSSQGEACPHGLCLWQLAASTSGTWLLPAGHNLASPLLYTKSVKAPSQAYQMTEL